MRIRDIVIGWPGSVHENRVWKTSLLRANARQNFTANEYLIGDSAYELSSIMVAPFKNTKNNPLRRDQERFNRALSKARIKSEHCIGILKGRFQFFRRMRIRLNNENSLRRIIDLFTCACILHNWLLQEPYSPDLEPQELEVEDDCSDVLNEAVRTSRCARRDQVFREILEDLNNNS
jgi:hypothetical protein